MEAIYIILIIVGALIISGIIFSFVISSIIYTKLLVRTSKDAWSRKCSMPNDEVSVFMFNEGLKWASAFEDKKIDLHIQNKEYNLYGQFFNFGSDKTAIIIGGRMESCLYGYYFAKPYQESGYNILVIDNRSHGLSDGLVNSLGNREYSDILKWSTYLHEEFNQEHIVYHGICIGSSAAIFALSNKNCPSYVDGMVAEGMFDTFFHSFRNHLKMRNKRTFPCGYEVMLLILLFSKANVVTNGPKYRIKHLKKPILFLHSKNDKASTPDQAEYLYDHCSCPKRLVWFENSKHSRIRVDHTKEYDSTIQQFLSDLNENLL